jgi:hypothetical protein
MPQRGLSNDRGSPRAFRAWPLAWPSPSGPLGRQRSPGSRVGACAHRRGDATGGSALDAGGADPDNARRSGSVSCDFARRPAHLARDDRLGQFADARDSWCVTAGCELRPGAGHRRGGQRPAPVRYRARGSGPGCLGHLRRESPTSLAATARHYPARSRSPCPSRASFASLGLGQSAWRAEGAPLKNVKEVVTTGLL